MKKYGVDEVPFPGTKHAHKRPTHCPECGQQLKAYGEVLLCPEHGSKPFETYEKNKDQQ